MYLQFSIISDDYVDYLLKYESRVMFNKKDERKFIRPYIGVVIVVANYPYFIPLSSMKPKLDYDDNGKLTSRCNNFTTIPLTRKASKLGKIMLRNMIPVPKTVIKPADFNAIKKYSSDESYRKYYYLLNDQLRAIKTKYDIICKNANAVYNQKCNENNKGYWKNSSKPYYLEDTCDFKKLEEAYKNWGNKS